MNTDTIKLASEQNGVSAGNLAEAKPASEEKPLENGEIQETQTEEVEAEETEVEEVENEETDEEVKANENEQKAKKPNGYKAKLEKERAKLSSTEQERDYWRSQALRDKSQVQETKVESKPDLSTKPDKTKFETADEYTEALIDWKADQKLAEREKKQKADSIKNEYQTKSEAHRARVSELSAKKEDWDEVKENFGKVQLPVWLEGLILETEENSAEIVYELGRNPEELKKFSKLNFSSAAREIGKIEARLAKPSTPQKETKTTKAPKPVTPVRSKGASTSKGYRDDMTQKEYEAWRNEQLKAKGAR